MSTATPAPGKGNPVNREADGDPAADRPRLTVVLPVLDEARDLGALLDQLRNQAVPPGGFEVVVADGGSTDGTAELVRERARDWPALRLIANPGRRSGPGRNAGVAAARGELVLFLDGHCSLPRPDYLERTVAIFDASGADCLARPQPLSALAEAGWARAIALARHSRWGHNPGSDIYGGGPGPTDPRSAGAAYRRRVLERLTGFDERFDACEDVEFNHRAAGAGFTAWRHPDLAVHYRPRSSPAALARQMFRYGRGRGRLLIRHPSTAPWPLLGPAVAPILLIAAGFGVGWGTAGLAALVLAAAWVIATLTVSLRLGRGTADALRLPVVFAAVHGGLVVGFWRGVLDAPRFRGPAPVPGAGGGEARRAGA
jgi:succinoglycan biosynthesis protein ExoA